VEAFYILAMDRTPEMKILSSLKAKVKDGRPRIVRPMTPEAIAALLDLRNRVEARLNAEKR
jgi:hypothetical protein